MNDIEAHEADMAKLHEQIPKIQRRQFREDDNEAMEKAEWNYLLQFVTLFEHLNDKARLDICNEVSAVEYNDKEKIINADDDAKFFFIILRGAATVFRKTIDNETIDKLGPYDCIGGISLYFDRPYTGTVIAKGPLKCLKMNHQAFKQVVQPILHDLERSAGQYNSFTNFCV